MIPLFPRRLDSGVIPRLQELISRRDVGCGDEVRRFEDELAEFLDVQYVICTNSGTSALLAALSSLMHWHTSRVVEFPAYGHPAGANAARALHADVRFQDIESPQRPLVSVFSGPADASIWINHNGCGDPSHASGSAPDHRNLIADCSQAFGCDNRGSFTVWTYSFSPHKLLTTGQGGALATNSEVVDRHARAFINQDPVVYETHVAECGGNLRMSNINAALGRCQLQQIANTLDEKRRVVRWYRQCGIPLPDFPWCLAWESENPRKLKQDLDREGIDSAMLYRPVTERPAFRCDETFPQAEAAADRLLYVPCHEQLDRSDVEHIARCLEKYD